MTVSSQELSNARVDNETGSIRAWRPGLPFVLVLISTALFVVLALAAHTSPYFGIDLIIARAVQSIHAQWFDTLMQVIDWPGFPPEVYGELALAILILYVVRRRWEAACIALSSVVVGAGGLLIKVLVDRPRPSPELIHVVNPALDGGKFSFTAGHVESYVAIIGFLWFLTYASRNRSVVRLLALAVMTLLIVLIGLSRVYSGEHWFSDVIGGYLFGGIVLVLTIRVYEWGKPRFFVKRRPEASASRRM